MIRISLYIKNPKSKISPIYLDIAFDGQRIQKALGISIETKYWDNGNKDFVKDYENAKYYKKLIEKITEPLTSFYFKKRTTSKIVEKKVLVKFLNQIQK